VKLPEVRLTSYLTVARICLASLVAIIVSGSLVRLTGSGLGCADWPRCSQTRFIDVSTGHAAIEQINRLFTGVVAAAVIAATLLSLRLNPRNRRLTRLSLALVAGVLAQVVLGGIVVISGLHPLFNMAHYLVSIVLVTYGYLLVVETRQLLTPEMLTNVSGSPPLEISSKTYALTKIIVIVLGAVLVAGTVVTGTGPHAGDETAPRFSLLLNTVVRIHGVFVWVLLALLVVLIARVRKIANEFAALGTSLKTMAALIIAQGGLGYLQYSLGLPAGLVAIHVALSVAVWLSVLALLNRARLALITSPRC